MVSIKNAISVHHSSNTPQTNEVNSTSWTLLFRHSKHIILIYAEPTTPLSKIKTELLTVLQERYPSGLSSSSSGSYIAIPGSTDEIALGTLSDEYDKSKGWTEMDTSDGDTKESPQSLGLKDKHHIAFAFVKDGDEPEFEVDWPNYDDYDDPMDSDA